MFHVEQLPSAGTLRHRNPAIRRRLVCSRGFEYLELGTGQVILKPEKFAGDEKS